MRVKVVMAVDVDPDRWSEAYGAPEFDLGEDVRHYVGGLVAGAEATRQYAIRGVDVKTRRVDPRED